MSKPPIRLLIVDDHPVVRDGLRGMFAGEDEFEVVADADNGRDGLNKAKVFEPDVILMDLRMPDMDGVEAIRALSASGLRTRALVLTTFDTDSDVLPAIEAGATGFLLKDAPRDELLRAVRAAARGETVLSPRVGAKLLGQVRQAGKETVTDRELEVLRLVAAGSSNREIAQQLFISEATVKTHLLHLYAKLGVNDRAGAVGAAFDRGFLTPGDSRRQP
jgi:DNA-binding NarL/FixJ family response regulator